MAAQCALCGGTGWLYSHRSWFTADGFSRARCSVCKGSGTSSYRADSAWIRFQRLARQSITKDQPHDR